MLRTTQHPPFVVRRWHCPRCFPRLVCFFVTTFHRCGMHSGNPRSCFRRSSQRPAVPLRWPLRFWRKRSWIFVSRDSHCYQHSRPSRHPANTMAIDVWADLCLLFLCSAWWHGRSMPYPLLGRIGGVCQAHSTDTPCHSHCSLRRR